MKRPLEGCKLVNMTPPAAIKDNASWTVAEVDTKDWDHLDDHRHAWAPRTLRSPR